MLLNGLVDQLHLTFQVFYLELFGFSYQIPLYSGTRASYLGHTAIRFLFRFLYRNTLKEVALTLGCIFVR